MNDRPTLVVVASDGHCNSMAGLCPPVFRYGDGGEYRASPRQVMLWKYWRELAAEMRQRAQELKARLVVIYDGDGPDRNKYADGYGLITMRRDEVVRLTVQALTPLREVADVYVTNRGTQAHEGGSGELAEMVAERLDSLPNPETGEFSWYWPKLDIDGVLCEFGHCPPSNSTKEHLRGAGARRTAFELEAAYNRMGDKLPQVAVFAHVHHYEDSGTNYSIRVLFTAAWKLPEAYSYDRGFGFKREPLMAWYWVCQDGQMSDPRRWERMMPGPKVVTL